LIASTNPGKITEIKIGLHELKKQGIKILTLTDVGVEKDPEETGKTFQENAVLKARYYGTLTNLPTIADDGGLIIPFLNNEPGIKSKRWMEREATDLELIGHTLHNLRGCTGKKRIAYLQTCLCFYDPRTEQTLTEQEKIKGHISEKASNRPTNGYPYRALFIVEKYNKYYDQLTEDEHHEVNHRLIALKRLTKKISNLL
ncbi:MAG: non-canonical purine NTP pyrophosphatase, partial [Patescibacteria group bacterium]